MDYTESLGHPVLRREIAQLYQQITPAQILVHAGAEEAIFNFMNEVLTPGDHLIVHTPCYQSLFEIADANGCQVSRWQTTESDGWALDLDFLRRNIRNNTRAIVFNCPHNPTGYMPSAEQLGQILAIAQDHHLLVFSDEVYRGLEYQPENRLPAACDLYDNAVSLGVMSKTFGLAGLRIGWIATQNQSVFNALAEFKDYTSICNSAPSELLAIVALQYREKIIKRNLALVQENLQNLTNFINRHSDYFDWVPPKAGTVAFPWLHNHGDSEWFCADLRSRKGVLLAPGSTFDYGNSHFRIGFGRQNFAAGLAKLEEYVQENPTV